MGIDSYAAFQAAAELPDYSDDRDDVLYGFAMEYDRTPEFLNQWRERHPQYADDLTELAAELDKPEEYDDRPLTAEEQARIDRHVEKFRVRLAEMRKATN